MSSDQKLVTGLVQKGAEVMSKPSHLRGNKKIDHEGSPMDDAKQARDITHSVLDEKGGSMNMESTLEESGILGKRKPRLESLEDIRLQLERHENLIARQQQIIARQNDELAQFRAVFGELGSIMTRLGNARSTDILQILPAFQGNQTEQLQKSNYIIPEIDTAPSFHLQPQNQQVLISVPKPIQPPKPADLPHPPQPPKAQHAPQQPHLVPPQGPRRSRTPDRVPPPHKASKSDCSDSESAENMDPASVPDAQRLGRPSKVVPEPLDPVVASVVVAVPLVKDITENAGVKANKVNRVQADDLGISSTTTGPRRGRGLSNSSKSKSKSKVGSKADGDEDILLDEEGLDSNQTVVKTDSSVPRKVGAKMKPTKKPSASTTQLRPPKQTTETPKRTDPAEPAKPALNRDTTITLAVDSGVVSVLETNLPPTSMVSAPVKPADKIQTKPTTPQAKVDVSTPADKTVSRVSKEPKENKENPEKKIPVKDLKDLVPPIIKKEAELDFSDVSTARAGVKRPGRNTAHIDPEEIEQEEKERKQADVLAKRPHSPTVASVLVAKQKPGPEASPRQNKEKRKDLLNRSMTVSKDSSERKPKHREAALNEMRKTTEVIKDRDLRKIHQMELLQKTTANKGPEKTGVSKIRDESSVGQVPKPRLGGISNIERSASIKPRSVAEPVSLQTRPAISKPLDGVRNQEHQQQPDPVAVKNAMLAPSIISGAEDIPIKRKTPVVLPLGDITSKEPVKTKPATVINSQEKSTNVSSAKKLDTQPTSNPTSGSKPKIEPPAQPKTEASTASVPIANKVITEPKSMIVPEVPNKQAKTGTEHTPLRISSMSPSHTPLGLVTDDMTDKIPSPQRIKLEPGADVVSVVVNEADAKPTQSKDISIFFPTEEFDLDSSTPIPMSLVKLPAHVKIEDTGNVPVDDATAKHPKTPGQTFGLAASSSSTDKLGQIGKDQTIVPVKREPDDPFYTSGAVESTHIPSSSNGQSVIKPLGLKDASLPDRTKALQAFKGTTSSKSKEQAGGSNPNITLTSSSAVATNPTTNPGTTVQASLPSTGVKDPVSTPPYEAPAKNTQKDLKDSKERPLNKDSREKDPKEKEQKEKDHKRKDDFLRLPKPDKYTSSGSSTGKNNRLSALFEKNH